MPNFCSVTVIGHLGRDPELKYTKNGQAVCDFSIATNDKSGGKDVTTWFRVSAWGKQGEHCAQYLAKGRAAMVVGRLSQREYQARDGTTKTSLEINASQVVFLGGRDDAQAHPPASQQAPAAAEKPTKPATKPVDDVPPDDGDVPF